MEKDNKIISFTKNRKKPEYRLKNQISIHICRKNKTYSIEWDSPDSNISEEEIYCILKKILKELSVELKKITYKVHDSYEISFTILYNEKTWCSFLIVHHVLYISQWIIFNSITSLFICYMCINFCS